MGNVMVASCRHCGKTLNAKLRYCPHCGGDNRKPPSVAEPRCPKCACGLEEAGYRGSTIDICPRCSGLWLDIDEFLFHTTERDTFSDPDIPRQYARKPLPGKSTYLRCVRCNAVMARKNFRRISGVLVDICRDHGVWLDAGELEQIRSFIASGGLDRSQDKAIIANRDAISKVASETKDLKTVFKTINKFDLKRILLQGF